MILETLYRVIVSPIDSIDPSKSPTRLAFLCVFLASLAMSAQWVPGVGNSLFSVVIGFMGYCVIWAIQSAAIDFFAQLFGHSAPRLALFAWLGVAQLPLTLVLPLSLITFGFGGGVGGVADATIVAVEIWVIVMQVITVRQVYNVSSGRALLIYMAPFLIILMAVIALLVIGIATIGTAFWV